MSFWGGDNQQLYQSLTYTSTTQTLGLTPFGNTVTLNVSGGGATGPTGSTGPAGSNGSTGPTGPAGGVTPSIAFTGSGNINFTTGLQYLPSLFTPTTSGLYNIFCSIQYAPIGGSNTVFASNDWVGAVVADNPNAFTTFGNNIPNPALGSTGGGNPIVNFTANLTAGQPYNVGVYTNNNSGTMSWGQATQIWNVLKLC